MRKLLQLPWNVLYECLSNGGPPFNWYSEDSRQETNHVRGPTFQERMIAKLRRTMKGGRYVLTLFQYMSVELAQGMSLVDVNMALGNVVQTCLGCAQNVRIHNLLGFPKFSRPPH